MKAQSAKTAVFRADPLILNEAIAHMRTLVLCTLGLHEVGTGHPQGTRP